MEALNLSNKSISDFAKTFKKITEFLIFGLARLQKGHSKAIDQILLGKYLIQQTNSNIAQKFTKFEKISDFAWISECRTFECLFIQYLLFSSLNGT